MADLMTKEEQTAYAAEHYPTANLDMAPGYNPDAPGTWEEHLTLLEAGGYPTEGLVEPGVKVEEPVPTKLPEYDPTAIPVIEVPKLVPPKPIEVKEAPAYKPSVEEEAWREMHGGEIVDILKEGGRGIPEETQQLMKQQIYDDLRARETENLRLLRNDMEKRGITNSGLLFSEEQKIRSTTTRALAASVTEIKIKSAFMKMASFENALGLSAQFLGYLQEQSRLMYLPKMATWEARERAKLVGYEGRLQFRLAEWQGRLQAKIVGMQASVDVFKLRLQQAYNVGNIYLAAEIAADAAQQQQLDNIELLEMEMEFAEAQAETEASGAISGSIVNGIFALGAAFIGV